MYCIRRPGLGRLITAPLVELSLFRDHRNSGCSAFLETTRSPPPLETSELCVGVAAATAVRSDVECTRELAGRSLQGQRRQKRHEAANDKTAGKNDHGYQQPLRSRVLVRDGRCDRCSDELYDLKQEAARRSQREVSMHGGAG